MTTTKQKPIDSDVMWSPEGSVTVKTDVPFERLHNMLISAFEGGSNYWIKSIERKYCNVECTYNSSVPFVGGTLIVTSHDGKTGKLTINTLVGGIALMSEKHPRHFSDLMNENDDATTADVFVQLAAFGEVVYG